MLAAPFSGTVSLPLEHRVFEMFLTQNDRDAIRASWRLVIPIKHTAAELFYKRLFELKPEYQALFKGDMRAQRGKLIAMLAFIVKTLDWPDSMWQQEVDQNDDLFLVLVALGRRHHELYKIPDESYDYVREALLYALDYGIGEGFTTTTRAAWSRLFDILSVTMRLGIGSASLGKVMEVPAEEGEEV